GRSPGGAFGPATDIPVGASDVRSPRVAVSGDGAAAIVYDDDGPTFSAVFLSADGSPSAPVPVAHPPESDTLYSCVTAEAVHLSDGGTAVVAWIESRSTVAFQPTADGGSDTFTHSTDSLPR